MTYYQVEMKRKEFKDNNYLNMINENKEIMEITCEKKSK